MDGPKPPGAPEAAQPTLISPQSLAQVQVAALPQGAEGRYQEVLMLGRGGMGEVLLCTDGTLGRQVAMKVIHADAAGRADRVQRFVREARLQGQLEHPSIVPVYDLGAQADGAPFFIMRRVHGVTLEEVLYRMSIGDAAARQKYTRRKLLEAFGRVCLAVDFAHARGILHRDLKPSNLMFGDFGEVYVMDWGLARLTAEPEPSAADESAAEASPQTQEGVVLGTPGYMAPEQIDRSVPLDPRADVYSLGAILFELLTLKRLHEGDSQEQVLQSTLSLPEGRPSDRSPDLDIPPELEELCARATALEREKRPSTARAIHDAVERFLEGERDLALRHDLADLHTARAVSLADLTGAARDPDESLDLRRRAIRELGQALALDQDHPLAAQTLVRLLSVPPITTPPEVEREIEEGMMARTRGTGLMGSAVYAGLVLYLPLLLWMGIRDWRWLGALYASVAVASAASAVPVMRSRPTMAWVLVAAAGSAIMVLGIGLVMGPFVIQPTVAALVTMAFSFVLERPGRRVVTALGVLSLVVPVALGWFGWWPAPYAIRDDALLLQSSMLHLAKLPAVVLLTATGIMSLVVLAFFVGWLRDGLSRAERKLAIQAWSLRQLLPERAPVGGSGAGGATAPRPGSSAQRK